ncbi:putative enzyme related to lactoylglutathione lyase [Kitasatospora sp. MAA4]|uniref:VOC family protein n=1 Tax=Kitasatospora sp. MAA4 TaxID=3035093 RepID=UPI0024750B13|nr:VOC family protein [Kitasatospora sp. MAA4]MDH6135178.1 putative enzyme related to lactoylglutathione lyase [Kitasatospora sp. MAA4]
MPVRDSYPDGAPCWADLTTSDPAGAQAFYGPILGWEFHDNGPAYGGYTMCLRGGRPAAALMPPPPGAEQLPTMWNVYFSTSDLDGVYAKVANAGGKPVMGPHDIPGAGRMAFAFDPSGASFGLWQPAEHFGAAVIGEAGAMCWNELNTPDGETADAFYGELFAYTTRQIGDGKDFDYTEWRLPDAPDTPVCGRNRTADPQPVWSTYFGVAEADRAAAQVAELGGRVLRDPFDTPYGRMVVCTDSGGAALTFCQVP